MPENVTPFEVIMAPFELYVAPVGSVFPDVDEDPDGSEWTLVGTSGDLNYLDEGVTVEHSQTVAFWRSLGSTGARKAVRSEEDLKIRLTLADLSLEQFKLAMNLNTITPTAPGAGVPGSKKIGLSRGATVQQRALLLRGPSPYGDNMTAQYEVPIAVHSGSPSVTFRKDGTPASLALEFTALVDENAANAEERFGRLVAQTAAAT